MTPHFSDDSVLHADGVQSFPRDVVLDGYDLPDQHLIDHAIVQLGGPFADHPLWLLIVMALAVASGAVGVAAAATGRRRSAATFLTVGAVGVWAKHLFAILTIPKAAVNDWSVAGYVAKYYTACFGSQTILVAFITLVFVSCLIFVRRTSHVR